MQRNIISALGIFALTVIATAGYLSATGPTAPAGEEGFKNAARKVALKEGAVVQQLPSREVSTQKKQVTPIKLNQTVGKPTLTVPNMDGDTTSEESSATGAEPTNAESTDSPATTQATGSSGSASGSSLGLEYVFSVMNLTEGGQFATAVGAQPGDLLRFGYTVIAEGNATTTVAPSFDVGGMMLGVDVVDLGLMTVADDTLTGTPYTDEAPFEKQYVWVATVKADCGGVDELVVKPNNGATQFIDLRNCDGGPGPYANGVLDNQYITNANFTVEICDGIGICNTMQYGVSSAEFIDCLDEQVMEFFGSDIDAGEETEIKRYCAEQVDGIEGGVVCAGSCVNGAGTTPVTTGENEPDGSADNPYLAGFDGTVSYCSTEEIGKCQTVAFRFTPEGAANFSAEEWLAQNNYQACETDADCLGVIEGFEPTCPVGMIANGVTCECPKGQVELVGGGCAWEETPDFIVCPEGTELVEFLGECLAVGVAEPECSPFETFVDGACVCNVGPVDEYCSLVESNGECIMGCAMPSAEEEEADFMVENVYREGGKVVIEACNIGGVTTEMGWIQAQITAFSQAPYNGFYSGVTSEVQVERGYESGCVELSVLVDGPFIDSLGSLDMVIAPFQVTLNVFTINESNTENNTLTLSGICLDDNGDCATTFAPESPTSSTSSSTTGSSSTPPAANPAPAAPAPETDAYTGPTDLAPKAWLLENNVGGQYKRKLQILADNVPRKDTSADEITFRYDFYDLNGALLAGKTVVYEWPESLQRWADAGIVLSESGLHLLLANAGGLRYGEYYELAVTVDVNDDEPETNEGNNSKSFFVCMPHTPNGITCE